MQWAIPVSLGDSHRGYRVLGTSDAMFSDYRYGAGQSLQFSNGQPFSGVFETVIGSEVAASLGYNIGSKITLSHGVESKSLQEHDDKPFIVTGILKPTGTPMDRVLLTSLAGIEALHIDWRNGAAPMKGLEISGEFQTGQKTTCFAFLRGGFLLHMQPALTGKTQWQGDVFNQG